MTDLLLAAAVAALLVAVGLVARRRASATIDRRPVMPADLGPFPAIVFFSSASCESCPPARAALAGATGGDFREYSWDVHPGILRRLRIERVPTTWVVDASGRVVEVVEGEPKRSVIEEARQTAAD